MSDYHPTRFVDNNHLPIDGSGGRAPQQLHALTREGVAVTKTWGDNVSRTLTLHDDTRNLKHLRLLYHPGFDVAMQYPENPDRTINYYHSGIRRHDVTVVPTLNSSINVRDLQRWEDVLITETWRGGGDRMSMLARFFETLHMFRITDPPSGQHLAWVPFDLNFARHLIEPISLKVGNVDCDVLEIREQLGSGLGAYVDLTVSFSFKLVRAMPPVGSLITAEGV